MRDDNNYDEDEDDDEDDDDDSTAMHASSSHNILHAKILVADAFVFERFGDCD